MNKGCSNCSQCLREWGNPIKCGKGKTEVITKWWAANGNRLASEGTINAPDCFLPHDADVVLDKLVDCTNKMLEKLGV